MAFVSPPFPVDPAALEYSFRVQQAGSHKHVLALAMHDDLEGLKRSFDVFGGFPEPTLLLNDLLENSTSVKVLTWILEETLDHPWSQQGGNKCLRDVLVNPRYLGRVFAALRTNWVPKLGIESALDICRLFVPVWRSFVASPAFNARRLVVSHDIVRFLNHDPRSPLFEFIVDNFPELGPTEENWKKFLSIVTLKFRRELIDDDDEDDERLTDPDPATYEDEDRLLNFFQFPVFTPELRREALLPWAGDIRVKAKSFSFYSELDKLGVLALERNLVKDLLCFNLWPHNANLRRKRLWFSRTASPTIRRETFHAVKRTLERFPEEPPTDIELVLAVETVKHAVSCKNVVRKTTGTRTVVDEVWLPMRGAKGLIPLMIFMGADYDTEVVKAAVRGRTERNISYQPYVGFEKDIYKAKCWRRWSDLQSIGKLPEELLWQIMTLVWQEECLLVSHRIVLLGLNGYL
jgi:hypothetical protein